MQKLFFKTFFVVVSFRRFIAPTPQPGGVILLSADDVTAAETTEEGRVPAHEV